MLQDDKIKKVFSSKLSDFEADIPESVWKKIDSNLSLSNKNRRKKIILLRVSSFSASIAAILILGFIFIHDKNNTAHQLSFETPVKSNYPLNKIETEKNNDNINSTGTATLPSFNKKPLYAYSNKKNIPSKTINEEEPDRTNLNRNISENVSSTKETETEKHSNMKEAKQKMATYRQINESSNLPFITPHEKRGRKGFSISVDGHAGFARQKNSGAPIPQLFLRHASMQNSDEDMPIENVPSKPQNEKKLVKMEHRQPISIGIKIHKELNNNLSLETGVVYSYLSSKIKPARPSELTTEGTQKFHYLGIPISLNYTFARLGKVDFYVSGGGMVQKDISGSFEGDQEIKNMYQGNITTVIKDEISQDNLQLSLMANVGASYPIYDKLNAYATFGGVYYFDAKNEYQTIYSDKKFQFDINFGLKFKF